MHSTARCRGLVTVDYCFWLAVNSPEWRRISWTCWDIYISLPRSRRKILNMALPSCSVWRNKYIYIEPNSSRCDLISLEGWQLADTPLVIQWQLCPVKELICRLKLWIAVKLRNSRPIGKGSKEQGLLVQHCARKNL